MWDSLESIADTASTPSVPPSNVNIFVLSLTPSFDILTVIGNLVLLVGVFVENVILPDISPVPFVTSDTNVGIV